MYIISSQKIRIKCETDETFFQAIKIEHYTLNSTKEFVIFLQVCAVHSSVQRERGAFSATWPAPASTAPPVRHIPESACANPDSGELSVNTVSTHHPCVSESSGHIRACLESAPFFSLQCVVLVYSERGAVVNAQHVYMPCPAITLQAIVCVCLDISDNCVIKVRYTDEHSKGCHVKIEILSLFAQQLYVIYKTIYLNWNAVIFHTVTVHSDLIC